MVRLRLTIKQIRVSTATTNPSNTTTDKVQHELRIAWGAFSLGSRIPTSKADPTVSLLARATQERVGQKELHD
jgi:hypothetical protein